MTFSIINSELNNRLQMVSKVVNSKNVLPILDNIIFTVEGDILCLKASDSENTLMTKVQLVQADGDGSFAVNARSITEAIKSLPSEQEVTLTYNEEDGILKVDYFSGMFSFPVFNAAEFPVSPALSEDYAVLSITDTALISNIGRTLFATAQDELRPVMNGIYFDLKADSLVIVASDGHQLVRCTLNDIKAGKNEDGTDAVGSFILPKKPAAILKNSLAKKGEDVKVEFDGRNIVFTAGDFTLNCRQIEGRYPNYNSVIPKNNSNIMSANRLEMMAALKRISPFSNGTSNLIRMHVGAGSVQFDAEDYDFSKSATEKMTCDYSGQEMNIGFKGVSVIELLDNISSSEVVAHMADPARPALFFPSEQPENEEILMLQMPMLIS